ncbi:MAG: hypothetical protein JWO69_127 [Thermoleophilia bacterium]|nr:hypothetical protein [Thermoleophilia bacterium]
MQVPGAGKTAKIVAIWQFVTFWDSCVCVIR